MVTIKNISGTDIDVSYNQLGEDAYPSIIDSKSNIAGGTLQNGTSDDFKDVPTE